MLRLLEAISKSPFLDRNVLRLGIVLSEIAVRYERLAAGDAFPGDRVGILRRMFRLLQLTQDPSDVVWLAAQLGRNDEDALLEWQIKLVRRPKTATMKATEKRIGRASRADKLEARDNALFLRVLDYRSRTGCPLADAIETVAAAKDGPLGLLMVTPKVVSAAVVKRAYLRRLEVARREKRIIKNAGMFGTERRVEPLPCLPRKGRPKRK